MAHFIISTSVSASLQEVKAGFTIELFLALSPPAPFPKVDLIRFDGCKAGDIVILKLHFPFFTQEWESHIISDEEGQNHWQFVDVGFRLPFFLSNWQHTHKVLTVKTTTFILDDITFDTPWWLPAWFMKPLLQYQFGMRKPVYKSYFSKR